MIKEIFQPLKPRNIRLFITADLGYFLSFWLIYINLAWLVYAMTKSSFDLGLLGAVFYLPMLFITPFSGVIADRFDRRLILVVCQAGIFIPAILLSWLYYRDELTFAGILLLTFLYAACAAVSYPSSQAYIQDLIENKADTPRVIGFLSTNTRTSQFISGALNGLIHLIGSFTAVFLFALIFNAIALYCFFRTQQRSKQAIAPILHQPLHDLRAGFSYIYQFSPFWSIVAVVATVNIFVGTYQFQLPVFVADYLGGNVHVLSYIYVVGGIGGIVGGIYMGMRKHGKNLMKITSSALAIAGIALVIFALSNNLSLSLVMSFIVDMAYIIVLAGGSATLLTLVADEMRGRAMGMFAMTFIGLLPLGQVIIGGLALLLSARIAMVVVGITCLAVAIWYKLNLVKFQQLVQPIYQTKAIVADEQPI